MKERNIAKRVRKRERGRERERAGVRGWDGYTECWTES